MLKCYRNFDTVFYCCVHENFPNLIVYKTNYSYSAIPSKQGNVFIQSMYDLLGTFSLNHYENYVLVCHSPLEHFHLVDANIWINIIKLIQKY